MGDIFILDSFNKYLETLPRDRNYPSTPFDKLPKKIASVEATVTKNQKFVTLSTIVKDCLGYYPNCTAEQIPLMPRKLSLAVVLQRFFKSFCEFR